MGAGARWGSGGRGRGRSDGLAPPAAVEGGAQGAPHEGPRDPPAVLGRRPGVVPERGVAADELGGLLEHVLLAGRALELGLGLDHPERRPAEPGQGEAHAGELLPREGRGDGHRHQGGHRGEDGGALEGGAVGRPGDEHRAQDAATRPGRRPGCAGSAGPGSPGAPWGAPRRTPRSARGEPSPARSRGRRARPRRRSSPCPAAGATASRPGRRREGAPRWPSGRSWSRPRPAGGRRRRSRRPRPPPGCP